VADASKPTEREEKRLEAVRLRQYILPGNALDLILAAVRRDEPAADRAAALALARTHWRGILYASGVWVHGRLRLVNNFLLAPMFTMLALELWMDVAPRAFADDMHLTNLAFCATFGAEWLLGLVLVKNWRAYLCDPWMAADGISSIPFTYAFQLARISRFSRVLRLVGVAKLVTRARKMKLPVRNVARGFGVAGSATLAGAYAIAVVEPQTVDSLGHAAWWALVTISTVGYGDVYPQTPAGRLIASLLILLGLGTFGYLTGVMAAAVHDEGEEETLKMLRRIEADLALLKQAMPLALSPSTAPTPEQETR